MPKEKIEKVLIVQKPKTKKELESFLRIVNHHRKFFDNYTACTEDLYDLLKEERSITQWRKVHDEQFQKCKDQIEKYREKIARSQRRFCVRM
ncbi:hypothetical protein M153_2409600099 [Pseudoloma neurophilia]|uniref:Uncharacterized protein n=1 Tax=Pseudoloma neurophilia TaxID=146866 RepID=A0A0R0LR29_9MICR|nr:hypothetical protein M153_2409600099 [Pseudoloma neurophilia]